MCLTAAEALVPEAPDEAEQFVDLVGPAWRAMFLSELADATHDSERAERLIRRAADCAREELPPDPPDGVRTETILRLARQLLAIADRRRAAEVLKALSRWSLDDRDGAVAAELQAMTAGGWRNKRSPSEGLDSAWIARDVVEEVAKIDLARAEYVAGLIGGWDRIGRWARARAWQMVITTGGERDPGDVSRLADAAERSLLGRLLRDDVLEASDTFRAPEVHGDVHYIAEVVAPWDPDRAEAIVRRINERFSFRSLALLTVGKAMIPNHPARAAALLRDALEEEDSFSGLYVMGEVAKLSAGLESAGELTSEIVDELTRMEADEALAESSVRDLTKAAQDVADIDPELALRLIGLAEDHADPDKPDDYRSIVEARIAASAALVRAGFDTVQATAVVRAIRDHLDRIGSDRRRWVNWSPLGEAVAAVRAETAARVVREVLAEFTGTDREVLLTALAPAVAVSDVEYAQELADGISDDDERYGTYIGIAEAVLVPPNSWR